MLRSATLRLIAVLILALALSQYGTFAAPRLQQTTHTLTNCTKDQLLQLPHIGVISEVKAEFCNIKQLENAVFMRFSSLSVLEITDSRLETIEDYALHGLQQLRQLSFARNNISAVKSWSNEQLSALHALDLRRNAIAALTTQSFQRYPNLQRLNLAANQIAHIDLSIFQWMPHLKQLNLGRNRLRNIAPHYFIDLHRLSSLALHCNEIASIERGAFASNTHLRTLRLEGNQLLSVSFLLTEHLVHLVHLNVSHNAIDALTAASFAKHYELIDLDLSHNRLRALPADAFDSLESLEVLNISHNAIAELPTRIFQTLNKLEHIDLAANQLTQVTANIFNATNLLQCINLSGNALQEINATLFSDMPYLTTLDLSANQLHADAFVAHLAPKLRRAALILNLADNRFSQLNLSLLLDFRRVELAGNWLDCKWLIREMLTTPARIHFGRNYAVATTWNASLLNVNGIDCYDAQSKRSIVVLDTGGAWQRRVHVADAAAAATAAAGTKQCDTTEPPNPYAPPLVWPKIRLDKFDSRSVIIWMLIAIAIAFSALRIARRVIDKKERKMRLMKLEERKFKPNNHTEELQHLQNSTVSTTN